MASKETNDYEDSEDLKISQITFQHVYPSEVFKNHGIEEPPIAASSLSLSVHFNVETANLPDLKSCLKKDKKSSCVYQRRRYGEVLFCCGEMIQKVGYLMRSSHDIIYNEAQVRYTIIDPFLTMLCRLFDYQIKLEDKVQEKDEKTWLPLEQTGRSSLGGSLSEGNKIDYSVYHMTSPHSPLSVVALIEAKEHLTEKAVAQAIGYYIRAEVTTNVPIVIVMSATEFRFILFPFVEKEREAKGRKKKTKEHFVNGFLSSTVKMWKDDYYEIIDHEVILFLTQLLSMDSSLCHYTLTPSEFCKSMEKEESISYIESIFVRKGRVSEFVITMSEKLGEMKSIHYNNS